MRKEAIVYTDGSAVPNPGRMGLGMAIVANNQLVHASHRRLGRGTNNQAEIRALYEALVTAKALGYTHIDAWTDSELLVNHFDGTYRIKDAKLRELPAATCHPESPMPARAGTRAGRNTMRRVVMLSVAKHLVAAMALIGPPVVPLAGTRSCAPQQRVRSGWRTRE